MNKIRIIDLLNKIANGEEIPKFWWNGCIHEVQKEYGTNKYSIFDTYCKRYKRIELEDLNEEIKFLEEKKIPEKIEYHQVRRNEVEVDYIEDGIVKHFCLNKKQRYYADKLNEVIDYLKSKGE